MTVEGFRRIAMGMPDASEGSHMDHPDFRVQGKVFATIPPTAAGGRKPRAPEGPLGVVKLTPTQQAEFIDAKPGAFVPCAGAWGAKGYTYVRLKWVDSRTLRRAILAAWRNTAPKRMVVELGPKDA